MELAAVITNAPWWFPTETVQLAFIAGGGGVLSAFIMSLVTAWNRSREKREDWRRQDEVAEKAEAVRVRAEETARLLIAANRLVTDKVESVRLRAEELSQVVAGANDAIKSKLEENHALAVVTHALVNNSMTATLQTLYDALRGQLVLMRELHSPASESSEAITSLEIRIKELKGVLDERRAQEQKVNTGQDSSNMLSEANKMTNVVQEEKE